MQESANGKQLWTDVSHWIFAATEKKNSKTIKKNVSKQWPIDELRKHVETIDKKRFSFGIHIRTNETIQKSINLYNKLW